MKIILIYFLYLTFLIDEVMGPVGVGIRGFSLFNLNVYLYFLLWALVALKRRKLFESNNVTKYIILLVFIVFVSIFAKILHGEVSPGFIKHQIIEFKAFIEPLLLFFIFFNIISDEKTCDRTLLGLYVLLMALILAQLSATFGITHYKAASMEQFGRAGGFSAAGEYSITLVLFLPLVLSNVFFMKKGGLFKIGFVSLVFFILVGLVNAGSRNGALTFLFSMMVYSLFLKRQKIIGMIPVVFLIIGLIMASAAAFVVSPSNIKEVVAERFIPSDTNDIDINTYSSGRFGYYLFLLKEFSEHPFLGYGFNSFHAPHNEYLRYMLYFGILGLVVYLSIYFKIIQNMWRAMKTTSSAHTKKLYLSYIAGLSGYLLGIFFTNATSSLFFFWIYTAVIYKYSQLDVDRIDASEVRGETVTAFSAVHKELHKI